jgi:hypothetical protein
MARFATLCQVIEQWNTLFKKEYKWELAIFIESCSVYQEPCTDEERCARERTMHQFPLWYASQWTDAWLAPKVSEDPSEADASRWSTFEWAISCLPVKSMGVFHALTLDLSCVSSECDSWEATEAACALPRAFPASATDFRAETARDDNASDEEYL